MARNDKHKIAEKTIVFTPSPLGMKQTENCNNSTASGGGRRGEARKNHASCLG